MKESGVGLKLKSNCAVGHYYFPRLRTEAETRHTRSIFYIACCVVVLMQHNIKETQQVINNFLQKLL